jgi:hypothetical protein
MPERLDMRNGRTSLAYILAASHSGSTLLAMLLGSHPDVCTVGELKATQLGDVTRYRCSCRTEIVQCSFWKGVHEGMARRGFPSFNIVHGETDLASGATPYVRKLLRPLHRGALLERARDAALAASPAWQARLARFQSLNAALTAELATRTGARVVVDSSKVAVRLKYLLRNPELDIRVIRLIRDGRGVALTYTDPAQFADARDPRLRGGGTGAGSETADRLTLAQAAREWKRSNEEQEALLVGLDRSRWTEVRYEEMCRDPESTLRKLFRFVGVNPEHSISNFRGKNHHVIGNGMRFDETSEIRLDERWRSELPAQAGAIFEAHAGPTNVRLGYR